MNAIAPVSARDRESGRVAGTCLRLTALVIGLALLAAVVLASLIVGARPTAVATVLDALLAYDGLLAEHIIIVDHRVPRTLLGVLCGAGFGVSGALIQAATRNPLADPGILGVNAGAAFSVTLAVGLFGLHSIDAYLCFAFVGAILVTLAVYALGVAGRDGPTPGRLVLSGVALSAVLGGIGSGVALLKPEAFDSMRLWSIGSIGGRSMAVVGAIAPFIGAGLALALIVARSLNAVALGDDLARSLGATILRARILTLLAVTVLAGAATAAVGPIGFVGLVVPHVVRWFTGPDQRWIIPMTMIYGPVLLLAADVGGRLILFPAELEAGIVTAFLGAPVLILLARRRQASGL